MADLLDELPPSFMKAIGDPNRIRLIERLAAAEEPIAVRQAAGCCAVDLSVVSRHLALLREAGIVRSRKVGRSVYYSLDRDLLADRLRRMADAIECCCPEAGDTCCAEMPSNDSIEPRSEENPSKES